MAEFCDLCRATALEPVYWPERQADSAGRDTVVHLCSHCGLVQSLPRAGEPAGDAAPAEPARKNSRTAACMKLVRAHADLGARLNVLDAGAHRGSFARAFADAAPEARITAVESAEDAVEPLAGIDRVQHVRSRIEDTNFTRDGFDIVHCCQVLEHAASPAAVLSGLWRTLKPGGLLIADAPNLTCIGNDDIVEEWFTDRRQYHFSPVTLGRALDAAGFEIIDGPNPMDRQNLTFAALKRAVAHRPVPRDAGEAERAAALIASYSAARTRNLIALTAVAAELRRLAPRRVAMWGAGRLFDALVMHGGFDPKSLTALVDGTLSAREDERHGVKLSRPDELKSNAAGIVVVMSRTFAREISRLARARAPKAEIILYGDLLARARMALAA